MLVVVFVKADFVGIYHIVVILHSYGLRVSGVARGLALGNVVRDHLVLQAILQRGGAGDAGTELEHDPVGALQLVSVAGYVRARAHEGHLADEHVPQFRQLVQFVVTELRAERSDAAVARHRDGTAAVRHHHRAELVAGEELAILAHALLAEERRAAGHLYLDEDGYDDQHRPENQQAEERCEDVE